MVSIRVWRFLLVIGQRLPARLPLWAGRFTDKRLSDAGVTLSLKEFDSVKRSVGVILGLVGLFVVPKPLGFLAAGAFYAGGTYLPELMLNTAVEKRAAMIDSALPELVELINVLTEAGVNISQSLPAAAAEIDGPLRDCLDTALAEIALGVSRRTALARVARETPSRQFKAFVCLLAEADRYGVKISESLRVFAEETRDIRFCDVRDAAQKVPIKMLFPLVFMILPAFLLLTVGPLAVEMMK